MKARLLLVFAFVIAADCAGADDALDRLGDALIWASADGAARARLSGTAEFEYYSFGQPAPGLIETDGSSYSNPRLTLFLDAQLGPRWYVFAQARADRGFDPGHEGSRVRLDEYAVRVTPGDSAAFNIQIGKFATIVGSWVPRHHSWENPFITAPVPYENPTGIFDNEAARSVGSLLLWGDVRPLPAGGFVDFSEYRVPIVWGPSYASGMAVSGRVGQWEYAAELKNASLSSRPDEWRAGQRQWQEPTWSGRLVYHPDPRWAWGVSFSSGGYLRREAESTLAPGTTLGSYRQTVFAQDLSYAWHHWQVWAECFAARFAIPRIGNADTVAYYVEAKYKFTPQLAGAVRWNQQLYGDVMDGARGPVRWGRNLWRLDVAPAYRFTPHTQMKLQYSLEHGRSPADEFTSEFALQLLLRF